MAGPTTEGYVMAIAARSVGAVTRVRDVAGTNSMSGGLELMGMTMSFPHNREIYGEGEPAEFLYRVVSGTVRTCRVLSEGRRQIGSFYLSGDMFGIECGGEHRSSAEAVTNATILSVRRAPLLLQAHGTLRSQGSCGRSRRTSCKAPRGTCAS